MLPYLRPRILVDRLPETVLVIPDTHFPFHHKKIFDILSQAKRRYSPDLVVHLGDEVDWQSLNFHGVNPDLPSNRDELREVRKLVKALAKIFPRMLLCESNHGALPFRRAFGAGLSREMIRTYSEILEAPGGWEWSGEINLGNNILIRHSFGKNIGNTAKKFGVSLIQGHFHENQELVFWEALHGTFRFGMTVGCLIDSMHEAFAYSHRNVLRPRLGFALIKKGVPILEPL